MEEREKRINALFCALSVMNGAGGGFSPRELSEAHQTLAAMLLSEQQAMEAKPDGQSDAEVPDQL